MLSFILVLTAQVPPVAAKLPFEQINVETAKARLAECGLGAVSSRYDEDLQSELLIPASPENATDEQLVCADRAISYYDIDLPPTVRERLDTIRAARIRPIVIADARRRLAERKREVPEYEPGVTNDHAFTREVERRCGPSATGAFGSSFGLHTLNPAWLKRQMERGNPDDPAFACVTDMAVVADYDFGFIGNEATTVPPTR